MIATDGKPNGGVDKVAREIRSSIANSHGRIRYQLLPCSDQEQDIAWMNDLDEEFGEVDCTDDYESEKREVLAVGLAQRFERSDWLMKALLGPISKKFDAWDMGARTQRSPSTVSSDDCCTDCC